MDAEWIKSPTARRILMHWADRRPAWLWSHDGATLLWHNPAARLFAAKIKKSGLKRGGEAVPIRGQVARLIRLGSAGRSSLSRVQFLAGDRPLATTCSCTPLAMPDGTTALLLVSVDPIAEDVREAAGEAAPDAMSEALFPAGWSYWFAESGAGDAGDDAIRLEAGPDGATLVLSPPQGQPQTIETVRQDEGEGRTVAEEETRDLSDMPEPMLPLGLEPLAPEEPTPAAEPADHWVEPEPMEPSGDRALSSLFDRLAEDASLYTTLTAADEVFHGPSTDSIATEPLVEAEPEQPAEVVAPQPDMIAAVIEYADDPEDTPPAQDEQQASQWLISGRGFRRRLLTPDEDDAVGPSPVTEIDESDQRGAPPTPSPNGEGEMEAPANVSPDAEASAEVVPALEGSVDQPPAPEPQPELPPVDSVATIDQAPDAETAERVSRYNFEELGRILTDRVASEGRSDVVQPAAAAPAAVGVINLNAETLVLNRLPLAIMVFRDQQVLFANRALTDLLAYDSVESLRIAGIAAIFPTTENANAGPVNQLVRRDGVLLPVTARLQSVSWQGRPALMLSASPAEPMRNHEAAVRAFAELAAERREEGFLVADRAGVITQLSGIGRMLLGERELVGKPLGVLVGKSDLDPLRAFLDKPARFAETARPSLLAASEDGDADIALFAEGQAGIVSGYFGFLKKRQRPAPPPDRDGDLEPSMLARLSRGVRRPLNTIIGFADLIRTAGLSPVDGERTLEYARDIRTAGLEIAVLVDELDDFTRLRDGRYTVRPSDVDLGALLESCMVRVRAQAGAARVLVRSAISERLPRIRADRASLGQALLNLLASAIDQTPVGGSVILSAQQLDEGGIAVHVRDGAKDASDLAERFVVFRDGLDRDGAELEPVRSSVGLALTRSLLAVNACSLSVDPAGDTGTLLSLMIPADLVVKS